MTDSDPDKIGPKRRLSPLIESFERLGNQAYATVPNFAYLVELEKAVQAEVDRMVVEMREEGYPFKMFSDWATFEWRDWPRPGGRRLAMEEREQMMPPFHTENAEPWQPWRKRYREAVKRLRGEDEEVLSLEALQERRRQIENLETQLRIGPVPDVARSADNQAEPTVRAAELLPGDCVNDGAARIVVRTEEGITPDSEPYVLVIYHDGLEYEYDPDQEFEFGLEDEVLKRF